MLFGLLIAMGKIFVKWDYCWLLKCAGRRCSNYIFILDLTPGFNGLDIDTCKTKRETFTFWDLMWLTLDVWWYSYCGTATPLVVLMGTTDVWYEEALIDLVIHSVPADSLALLCVIVANTENKISSIWQPCRHWWHRKLSLWQLTVPPATTRLSIDDHLFSVNASTSLLAESGAIYICWPSGFWRMTLDSVCWSIILISMMWYDIRWFKVRHCIR